MTLPQNGWVKLHRKVLLSPVFEDERVFKVWVYLLLRAAHQEQQIMMPKRLILIKEGQIFTGRLKLAQALKIPPSTIEGILTTLEKAGNIRQQKTTKYRLITIINWKEYQEVDSKATAKRQQGDTYKNTKKIRTNTIHAPQDGADPKVVAEIIDLFKDVNPSYQRLFGMPPQRAAVERLLKAHGKEKLESMIKFLPKSNAAKYAPTITTPVQFEAKLGELIAWSNKQKDVKKPIVV